MKLFKRVNQQSAEKPYKKVVSDRALNKAAKESIEDQRRLSKKAAKLRTQSATR